MRRAATFYLTLLAMLPAIPALRADLPELVPFPEFADLQGTRRRLASAERVADLLAPSGVTP